MDDIRVQLHKAAFGPVHERSTVLLCAAIDEIERLQAIARDARDHVPPDVLARIDAALGNQSIGRERTMSTKEQGLADTILAVQEPERLRAENERLRAALRDLIEAYISDVNPNDRNETAIEHARRNISAVTTTGE